MLSEAVLAEIARPGPTQAMIVSAAWPSLSVESRLQVIAAIQGSGAIRSTPDWLLDLAMQDGAAIVRYWAARFAYFREVGEVDFSDKSEQGLFKRKPADPKDLERASAARNDPEEIVRLSVDRPGFVLSSVLTAMPQKQRLIAIRNDSHPSFSTFIDWICTAVDEEVTDDDLAACASEFFAHPEVIAQMNQDDFSDGMTAHIEGKALTHGWALLKDKAGPRLTSQLVWRMPIRRGLGSISAEELSAMPARVITDLLRRRDDDVLLELAALIRKQPERFSPDVVKSLRQDDEERFTVPDTESQAEYRLTHAVDRQAATVEAVIGIRREILRLRERVDEVYEAATRKRGFFG